MTLVYLISDIYAWVNSCLFDPYFGVDPLQISVISVVRWKHYLEFMFPFNKNINKILVCLRIVSSIFWRIIIITGVNIIEELILLLTSTSSTNHYWIVIKVSLTIIPMYIYDNHVRRTTIYFIQSSSFELLILLSFMYDQHVHRTTV